MIQHLLEASVRQAQVMEDITKELLSLQQTPMVIAPYQITLLSSSTKGQRGGEHGQAQWQHGRTILTFPGEARPLYILSIPHGGWVIVVVQPCCIKQFHLSANSSAELPFVSFQHHHCHATRSDCQRRPHFVETCNFYRGLHYQTGLPTLTNPSCRYFLGLADCVRLVRFSGEGIWVESDLKFMQQFHGIGVALATRSTEVLPLVVKLAPVWEDL